MVLIAQPVLKTFAMSWHGRIASVCTAVFALLILTGCQTAQDIGQALQPNQATDPELERRAAIRVELAANYFQQGSLQVAINEANEAIRILPTFSAAYGMLGLIYMNIREDAKAEENFKRSIQLAPKDPDLNLNFGWFLCQTGRERESMAYFETAARDPLYRSPAKVYQNAGICSRRLAKEGDAEAFLRKGLALEPNNAVIVYNLAEVLLNKGDITNAQVLSERLISGFEPTAQTLWLAIRVQRKLGATEQVASYATQLRRRFPESPELKLFLQNRYE
jgi:type IV pilus assembly protein PilF